MKRRPSAPAFLCAIALTAGSLATADPGPAADEPALVIDGEAISLSRFQAWLVRTRGEAFVTRFTGPYLLERALRGRGIALSDEEVETRVEADAERLIQSSYGGDRERWRAQLERLGTTPKERLARDRIEIRPRMLAERLIAATHTVAEADVIGLFGELYGKDGRRLELRVIRLRPAVPPTRGQSAEERRRVAEEARAILAARLSALRERVIAGEDFGELAREHSDDRASSRRDGELERFEPSEWPTELVEALYALEPGEVSSPLHDGNYVNIFQLVDEQRVELEVVRDDLVTELRTRPPTAAQIREVTENLQHAASVVVLPAMTTGSETGADVVLTVDGEGVTRDTFGAAQLRLEGKMFARFFTHEWLAAREAETLGVEVRDEEAAALVDAMINETVDRFYEGDPDRWRAALELKGGDEARFRGERELRARLDLLVDRILVKTRTITPEQVRALWEQRWGPGGRVLDVRMIRRAVTLTTAARQAPPNERQKLFDAKLTEVMAELDALRARVLGGEDFGGLAEAESDDTETRSQGGRHDQRFPIERWPDYVQTDIGMLDPGGITEPRRIGSSCYLFELVGVEVTALDSVRDALRAELEGTPPSAADRGRYLNTLLAAHTWEVFPKTFGAE